MQIFYSVFLGMLSYTCDELLNCILHKIYNVYIGQWISLRLGIHKKKCAKLSHSKKKNDIHRILNLAVYILPIQNLYIKNIFAEHPKADCLLLLLS